MPFAREVLSQFPILNTIFENFNGYEDKGVREARNFIFIQASPKIVGDIGKPSIDWLKSVEEALSLLSYEKWSSKWKEGFLSRFKSDDFFESISPSSELLLAQRMIGRFGRDKVEI